ncbi:ATP-binding protein [Paenibacillus mendelii]|uniref:histidine kinase n=1 Tax=Paenibacillus mendelii TaxID=206163 RepID=A0ABV6J1M6_9BACL|nr:ATP-binding protein [Paenibacillus mendelii]MCQ6563211.1 ATP-binding protein [Paenibacillus mendelii]
MHINDRLSGNRRNLFLYLILVLAPLCVFSTIYLPLKTGSAYSALKETAYRTSGFHALYIENFFGETIGRLESAAIYLSSVDSKSQIIDEMLRVTHNMDSRFSGFYWVSAAGDIIQSSNPLRDPVNLGDRSYFQLALETGKTQISEAHIGRVTQKYIFSIATPVYNKSGLIDGVLVGSIQLHEMEETLTQAIRGERIQLIDQKNQVIAETKPLPSSKHTASSYVMLDAVPWKVNAIMSFDYRTAVVRPYLVYLGVLLLLLNIAYLLAKAQLMKRQLAKELAQIEADKLKLIGTIAASTAHEIRNPLTGIKGFIALLSDKYKDDKDQYYFSLIQTEVNRINAIVSELLIIGKPTEASTEIHHVNDVVAEMVPLIESEAHLYNVGLRIELTNESAFVKLSKDHFKQIILNLVKNALEAMEKGGDLSIVTEVSAEFVLLKVTDTGKGMPLEVLEKVFTPFFTMKENGTGLGLLVCKRILDSYGGRLFLLSEVGKGTEATIQLPRVISSP